ncbi:MAG: leucine-rich repeat domain-containing protein [Sphingobacteriia bacterium]|nr:leucine-rich repeat domain-containing protein [Sphingobacteriia bacterium]
MKIRQISGFLLPGLFLLFAVVALRAQETNTALSADDIARYKEDARQMVAYLQFTFNTLGNPEVPAKEKDIIINQSWIKIFENERVQIEDDLDENRDVPLNKDIQAYLKDIDFFFEEVTFDFTIQNIEEQLNEKNQLFFKITTNRNLKGTTVEGEEVNSNKLRYVEINLNDESKDLKVASIYTTKLNQRDELRRWWNELPDVWRRLLGSNVLVKDTLNMNHILWFNDSVACLDVIVQQKINHSNFSFSRFDTLKITLSDSGNISAKHLDRQIQKIIQIDTVDISGMNTIVSLEPVTKMPFITYLNISETAIKDLMPARNLTHLEFLNCSGTLIEKLDAIRYLTRMQDLNLSHTNVSDIEALTAFAQLRRLNLSKTKVADLHSIKELRELKDLDVSGTSITSLSAISTLHSLDRLDFSETTITDISPLKELRELVFLKFEKTPVSSLHPLRTLPKLNLLFIDYTRVSDLSPLDGMQSLGKIYCDQSLVSMSEVVRFMDSNPQVLIIYETDGLIYWWNDLPPEWEEIFSEKVATRYNPTREELHDITRIRTLDIANIRSLTSLEPVTNMPMLNEIFCQGTGVTDLSPLQNLTELRELNCSDTKIADLSPLENLTKLNKLAFDQTNVASIQPLMKLENLRAVYCDNTPVDREEIVSFMSSHPHSLVVYQTDELRVWWDSLPDVWRLLADNYISSNSSLNREQLQELANLKDLDLNDMEEMDRRSSEITSLDPLKKMILLETLKFSNTRVSSLQPLQQLKNLHKLVCSNNPINSLQPLGDLQSLVDLDIQNTPVTQLLSLAPLRNLQKLNCSGTQIKNLKGLEFMEGLVQLDCYNTSIRNLKPVENLPNLKLIKCYNTNISKFRIAKLSEARPDVEIIYY